MKKIPLKLYKEFVEENGLETKLEKWAKGRLKSDIAKPQIELGKEVDRRCLEPGHAYWTGEIDKGGPEAWIYTHSDHLTCFGTFVNPIWAKKCNEISIEDFDKYVEYWIKKRYGVKYYNELHSVEK